MCLALLCSPVLFRDISEWIQILQTENKTHSWAIDEVNSALGTSDGNLIEMSVARSQRMHRMRVFVSPVSSSLLVPPLLVSPLLSPTGGEPRIGWRAHLTRHPNNRGWPWAVSRINHLTFPSRHQLPSPPASPPHAALAIELDPRQLRKTVPDSLAYEGRRQSSTIPHDCQYKSDGSNYPSPSRGQEQAFRPLFNFNAVQPYYTLLGVELRCMSGESRI